MHHHAVAGAGLVEIDIELRQVRKQLHRLAAGLCHVSHEGAGHHRFRRHIETDNDHSPGRGEDEIGRFRIAVKIGLGRRRHIAVHVEGAAHDDHLLHQRREVRFFAERQRQIGHATDGNQRHLTGIGLYRLDDETMCGARVERQIDGLRDIDIAETVFAMDEGRPVAFLAGGIEGHAGTPGDRCCHLPFPLQEERIAGGDINGRIAENGGNADQIDIGMAVQEQKRHGVIHTGVRIEYHFMHNALIHMSQAPSVLPATRHGNITISGNTAIPLPAAERTERDCAVALSVKEEALSFACPDIPSARHRPQRFYRSLLRRHLCRIYRFHRRWWRPHRHSRNDDHGHRPTRYARHEQAAGAVWFRLCDPCLCQTRPCESQRTIADGADGHGRRDARRADSRLRAGRSDARHHAVPVDCDRALFCLQAAA
ncbi:hypothetical protein D3C86_1329960 [compost metagenome]